MDEHHNDPKQHNSNRSENCSSHCVGSVRAGISRDAHAPKSDEAGACAEKERRYEGGDWPKAMARNRTPGPAEQFLPPNTSGDNGVDDADAAGKGQECYEADIVRNGKGIAVRGRGRGDKTPVALLR
mmetsp:Transcript_37127/g.111222  ORF Transcript_37127/g.111222 Transcript_37127/m.111222 type:complete len:127 (-) Transcript_37127:591-971(-)